MSTSDLVKRVRAAIEETMRIARDFRHGIDGAAGPWVTGEIADHLVDHVVYRPSPDMYDRIVHVCRTDWAGEDALPLARHIAMSADPQALLRRCEADLRTLDRHKPELIKTRSWCKHCERLWPCVEFLDRAAAYGVPVEEAT